MKEPSKKLGSSKGKISKEKPKVDPDTPSYFEKAKLLFPLDKRANAATERGWKTYTANRLAAEDKFHGAKNTGPKYDRGVDDSEEDEDEDEVYDPRGGELDYLYALNLIRRRVVSLEKEMELDKGVLSRSFRLLSCDPLFVREEKPRTVNTVTRIYSPTRPVYIDVDFQYHRKRLYYSTQWEYSLHFKIYDRPGTDDYENGRSGKGWRCIAYGSYDNCGRSGKRWVKVEDAEVCLDEDDVKDVYKALWGPLDDIQGDDEDEKEMDRRGKMVDTVCVLMAAVGIEYTISIDDDDPDEADDVFMLEGLDDRWFARGVRKACGFQLAKDPENEKKGLAEREAEKSRNDYPEDDSDDDGGYYDEGSPSEESD